MITYSEARPYDIALQVNAEMAKQELAQILERALATNDPEVVKWAIPRAYSALVAKYGNRAAAVAVEFYRGVRLGDTLPPYEATVYTYSPDVDADIGLTITYSQTQPVEKTIAVAGEMLHRRTYEAADNTILQNAKADPAKPKYKLMPHPGACAWCGLLALNEWDNIHYEPVPRHSDCKCIMLVDFDSKPGYEKADELLKPYRDAYDKAYTNANNAKWSREFREMSSAEKAAYGGDGNNPRDAYMRNRLLQTMNVEMGVTKHTVIDG